MSSAIDPAVLQAALDRFSALQSHDNQSLRPSTPLFSSPHDDGDDDDGRHHHHHRPAGAASPVTTSVDEQQPQTHLLQAINLLAAAAMSDEPCGGPSPDGLRRLAIDAVQRYLDDGQAEERGPKVSKFERCLEGARRCLRLLPALAAGGISASIGGALVGRAVAIDITNALHNIITIASRRQAGSTTATSSGPTMPPAFPTSAAMTVAAVNVMREWLPLVDRLFRVFASLSWCEPDHSDDSALLLPQQSHEDDDTVRDSRGLPSSTANPHPTLSPTLDVRPDATGDELPPRYGNAGNGCCAHQGGGPSTWAATVRGMLTPLVSLAGACAVGRERCDDRDGAGPWHARFAVTALSQALAVVADAPPNGDHRSLGTAAAEAVTAACPDAEIERIAAAVDVATASMLAIALQRALLPE